MQIGKCQAKVSNYAVLEEQFNKKYNENLLRNILGIYEAGVLELKGEEYEKEIAAMKKDIAALKHEKTKNDEDYVRYGRNQDDFREVIIEKKSSFVAEKERLADFEL